MDRLKSIYKKEVIADLEYFFITGVVLIFSLLRMPSLVEPEWYGDEGVYQVIGHALNSGRLLYRDIWDNKPPILYLYYALVNGDLFWIKFLSLIFGALAVVFFFYVSKALFGNKKFPVYFSTLLFAILFGLPLLEGNIANAENFMLFPIILSLFFILKLKSTSNPILLVVSGLLLSLSFLTKIVAIFDLGAFLCILFALKMHNKTFSEIKKTFTSHPLKFLKILKPEIILLSSFIVPILITSIFFLMKGAFYDFLTAVFSQNVGYVGYRNFFIIPQGLLIIKLLLLFTGVISIFIFRKKIGIVSIIIYLWLSFSLFNAYFSGRPYTHYLLVLLPSFCLFMGLILLSKKLLILNIFLGIFLVIFVKSQFGLYTKIPGYYGNYLAFIMGKEGTVAYQSFFDPNTPRNYAIADFLKANTGKNEQIFLLSDDSMIYYLSGKLPPGKYIVEYHISYYKNGVDETRKAIQESKPKYMVVTKSNMLPYFVDFFKNKYQVQGATIYER